MSQKNISRRRFLKDIGVAGGTILFSHRGVSSGLAFPGGCPQVAGKVVRWIVPNQPGGGNDTYSRLIAPFYEEKIGAKIFVTNMPGAGSILGAKALRDARPDGLTVGLLQAPGLLITALTGDTEAPNPATDFTILGRVERDQEIWAIGSGSSLRTMEDLLAEAKKRPIIFGVTDVGSSKLVNIAVTSSMLGINAEFIAGYHGSRGASLAAIRGEVDVVAYTFESLLDRIEAGDLRPLLQVSVEPISSHPCLVGVPVLGGDNGLASRRTAEIGHNVEEAKADAAALAGLIGGGRVVAAPAGLREDLFLCLEQKLHEALTDPGFKAAAAKAKRPLDMARADAALAGLQAAARRGGKFIPMVKAAIEKTR